MKNTWLIIPGILQKPEGIDDWADQARDWIHWQTNDRAVTYEYRSRALTRWRGQAARIRDCSDLARRYKGSYINVVAHSNGCDIILAALRECTDILVSELHLFAAAAEASFDHNGLNVAAAQGRVGSINLYGSHNDKALKWATLSRRLFGWLGLGYGDLGRFGPRNVANSAEAITRELWRDHYGHSTWFDHDRFDETMRLITM